MASTYSTNLRFELIGAGEQQGVWNVTTNTNLGSLIEQAIAGYEEVTINDANYTLTTNYGAIDQARNMTLKILSSVDLTATRQIVVPTNEKIFLVWNATTGGQSLTFKTSAGSGVTIANGTKAIVYVNGTDVVTLIENPVPISQGGSGATTASAARTALAVPGLADNNTLTGTNDFKPVSGTSRVYISSAATGNSRYLQFRTVASPRWEIGANSTAESGSNAGSMLVINSYDDSGTYLETPFYIDRATSVTNLRSLTLNNPLPVTSGGTGGATAAAARSSLAVAGTGVANTFTTTQTFDGGVAGMALYLTGAASQFKVLQLRTAGVDRITFGLSSGDNFFMYRYDDAGVNIGTPFQIVRSTGAAFFEASVTAGGTITSSSTTGGVGYSTGAGGTITQTTSKTTSVSLARPTGQITMNNASLAAGASASFTVVNSVVAATDVVIANITSGAAAYGSYRLEVERVYSGNFVLRLTNTSGGALSEALVINFAVIKGITA